MTPPKLSSRRSWLVRYAAAVAAVAGGLLLRMGLTALVGEGLPTYITFYPAVMVVALLGGFGPGLVATAASALVVDYFLLTPRGAWAVEPLVDAVGLAFFSGMGVFMSLVAALYRRARQKAAMYEKQLPPWERQDEPPQPLGKRLLLYGGMALSLAILAAAGWQAQRNTAAMVQADRWVTHIYGVNEEIEHFLIALQDMDASVRAFVLTGREEDLRLYFAALPQGTNRLSALKAQTLDNPAQTQRVAGLETLLGAKVAVLQETIALRRTTGFEAAQAMLATGRGRALTEEIRQQMAAAQAEEDRLLDQRTQTKETSLGRARQALLAGGVLGFLLLGTVFFFLRQENAGRRQAEAELRRHRDYLQDIVTARTAELAEVNQSLRQSREDLDRAQAVGQIGWWRLDTRHNVLTWSDETYRIFGLPKGAPLTYETFLGAVHPDDRQNVDAQWKASVRGEPYDLEHRIVANGQVKWVREKAYLELDAAGQPVGGFGITQDITDRKTAEEALRASEEQLRQHVAALRSANLSLEASRKAAFNLMEDALQARRQAEAATLEMRSAAEQRRLALEAADLGSWDYHFQTGDVFWDERCRDMWGMGQSEQTDYATAISRIHPEDRPGVETAVARALAGHEGGAYHCEFRVVWPDGSVHWIASHGHVYFQGEDDQRCPVRFIGANLEITERKRAEHRTELLASTAGQLLASDAPQRVVEDLCRRVLTFLECQLFFNFLVEEEVAGTRSHAPLLSGPNGDALSHVPTGVQGRLHLNAYAGIPAQEAHRLEWLDLGSTVCGCAARDGCCIVLNSIQQNAYPQADLLKSYGMQAFASHPLIVQGRVRGTLSFGTRTRVRFTPDELALMQAVADQVAVALERARAQAALQQTARDLERSNRDLERFAYVASHDLQEPLRAVGGYVKLLERHFAGTLDAKARKFIAGAFEGAVRMERLIHDLLAFSRAGTRGGNFVPVNLDSVLQHALDNLRPSIQSAQATITHEPLPTVTADGTQLMQVFQNLIGNALKFRAELPPAIHIRARQQDGRWVFSVRDNGIGIDPQYHNKLFHLFQRLHTRRQYAGTGIGLAICKRIIERHQGTIWVESQPGQGSTFYFSLPEKRG